jgi:putative FmdB family regulatory protein
MPIYEYRCGKCGKVLEKIQKFSDAPLVVHEECGGPLERLISTSALQFKGSGWYVNDYAKGGSKPATSSASEGKSDSKADGKSDGKQSSSDSKSESKGETKSETKSESKSESKPAAPASKSD